MASEKTHGAERRFSYEVIVGNIGTVYNGSNGWDAAAKFNTYVGQSKRGEGRAAGESVVIMRDGEVHKEYVGTIAQQNAEEGN